MRSKIFSFKKNLVKNNLRHSWPLWVCSTLPLVMWQFAVIADGRSSYGRDLQLLNLGETIRGSWADMASLAPYFNLAYGALAAMLLLDTLYTGRSAVGTHAMPVTREQKWLSWVISGFLLEAIPVGVTLAVGTLGWLGMPGLTFGSLPLIGTYVVWMFSTFAWGFGFAMFCGMFTGQLWALPLFTIVLNFLGLWFQFIWSIFQDGTFYGYYGGTTSDFFLWLSPFVRAVSQSKTRWENGLVRVSGTPAILALGALGLVFMVLALVIYRIRPLERAGELVVFRPFRRVFRIGFAFCIALVGGVFGGVLAERIGWEILAYLLIFGALGLALAQVLVKKSFRILSKGIVAEYLIVFGLISAVFVLMLTDGFGFNSWTPSPEQVEAVTFRNFDSLYVGRDSFNNVSFTTSDPEQIEAIVQWHRDYLEKYPTEESIAFKYSDPMEWGIDYGSANIVLQYHMKNGRLEQRMYDFRFTSEDINTAGSMEWQLEQIWSQYLTPEQYLRENTELWEADYYYPDDNTQYLGRARVETVALVDALCRDLALRHARFSLLYTAEDLKESEQCDQFLSMYGGGYTYFNLTEERYPNAMLALQKAQSETSDDISRNTEVAFEK